MTAQRQPEEPPLDWKPKSRFVRWYTKRARWHQTHPHVLLPCPNCGAQIGLVVTTKTEEPDFVVREDDP